MKTRTPSGPESKSQYAYRLIEELIVTLELPPGTRVTEAGLSEQLGIGRTPVREALQRLARERSIEVLPRSGAVVTNIDVMDHFKLIEVRRGLERVIAVRAARLAGPIAREQFADLKCRFERACEAESDTDFIAADRQFNKLLVDTADNVYAADAIAPLQAQTRRFWYLYFTRFGDIPRVCALHAAIADAVAQNAEEKAGDASDRLLDYVEEYTRKTLHALA
ncbi:MAG: GntR family transcriptional regulator [Halofilum sp. (in: g-proteobacteria)]